MTSLDQLQIISSSLEEIITRWRGQHIRRVVCEVPDLHGLSRSRMVPLDALQEVIEQGLGMYGGMVVADSQSAIIAGTHYNEEKRYANAFLVPDLSTATVLPWIPHTARLICDLAWQDGTPLAAAPRQVLRQVVQRLETLGYSVRIALEYEFYLLDESLEHTVNADHHIFHTPRNVAVPVIERLLDDLPQVGIEVLATNGEYGPGQFEITSRPQDPLRAADQGFTLKQAVKMVAVQCGYSATFMTRPFQEHSASGGHTHLSLYAHDGSDVFTDETGHTQGLSKIASHVIAGMLTHAPAVMALTAPTPNCYHRVAPHLFAPISSSWGIDDRTAMVRVKRNQQGHIHLENRQPTAISNPYLATAAVLAAALLGLQEARLAPAFQEEPAESRDAPALPTTLEQALEALERDSALKAIVGEELVHIFLTVKRSELVRRDQTIQEHMRDVERAWERAEYLRTF